MWKWIDGWHVRKNNVLQAERLKRMAPDSWIEFKITKCLIFAVARMWYEFLIFRLWNGKRSYVLFGRTKCVLQLTEVWCLNVANIFHLYIHDKFIGIRSFLMCFFASFPSFSFCSHHHHSTTIHFILVLLECMIYKIINALLASFIAHNLHLMHRRWKILFVWRGQNDILI